MSATAHSPRPASLNRRRRVRQKVHAPAYATFGGASKSEMLDLYEVLDISEIGVAVQCPLPMELDKQVELCLDLAECSEPIRATARVVWTNSAGKVGLGFPPLRDPALQRLRGWLFLNAMAAAANAGPSAVPSPTERSKVSNYTDTLSAVSAVQREAESLGSDLEAILSLVASRSQSLLRASGSAIALAGREAGTVNAGIMICRASVGQSAPPLGAMLQVGSGFSGACVLTGKVLRCDDTETDERVDRQSCRALGIRSRLAAPVRSGERVIGVCEVFSSEPGTFSDQDGTVLQRFADTILAAVNRAKADVPPTPPSPPEKKFSLPRGGVLFASEAATDTENKTESANENGDQDQIGGVRLPRTHLYLLIAAAATIALVLGFSLAPWIQQKIQARSHNDEHTVLASSQPPAAKSQVSVEAADLAQLEDLAKAGDAAAENALGLLYAQGDAKQSVAQDDSQAARWFTRAAEDGRVPAQYKLGLLYWGGHGVPKNANKAYFWAVLARAGGQEGSKDLAKVLANGMTRAQSATIEQQAEIWYQQHESRGKPQPGH